MRASACASRSNAACARAVTRSGKPAAPICSRIDAQPLEPVDRRARVQQRAEQHVAGDAADAVDVEDHAAPAERRAIRAAIVPAPNPSSMFTTATPAAHDVSMASSALTPPNVAP